MKSHTTQVDHKVAVLGTGSVGQALARGLARAGVPVALGSRRPAEATAVEPAVEVVETAQAVQGAAVVVLALPVPALAPVIGSLDLPPGIVLVDATNAVRIPVPDGRATVAEHVAALAPQASVVKAFNTIGAEHLDGSPIDGRPVFLPIAGHDAGRGVVAELAAAMGFDVADLGGPEAWPLVEAHAQLWIRLAIVRGWGRDWGLAVVRS